MTDRLPPNDKEAELGILGCVMLDNSLLGECVLKISPEFFYDLQFRTIYEAMLSLHTKATAVDLITLSSALRDSGMLEEVGGIIRLSGLADSTPSSANLQYYIDIATEKFKARKLLEICSETAAAAYNTADAGKLAMEHDGRIASVVITKDESQVPIKQAVLQSIDQIERAHASRGMSGIPTGFLDIDRMTCGLQPAEMVVIAGRPSTGKTALAMNIVEHVAVELRVPVGVFSIEMSTTSLVVRMLCSRARINGQRIREGMICTSDFAKLGVAAASISKAPIFIDASAPLTLAQFRAKVRAMVKRHGIKVVVVDYLQLMSVGHKSSSRQEEVSEMSSGIKAILKELNISGIILCQMNREADREGRHPRLSDLRESGAIEQDADVVGMLYRPKEEDRGSITLCIEKQRNGPVGPVPLVYMPEHTRFESAAKISREDIPQQHND